MGTPSDNVFAPPRSNVTDVQAGEEGQKASRGARFGAKFIDGLAFGIGFAPAYMTVLPAYMHGARTGNTLQIWSALAATGGRFYIGILVCLLVIVLDIIWISQNGQTVGKKLCGIKIVRTDGSKATLGRIFLMRYLISSVIALLPLIGMIYTLVDICFIFGSAKRCVHDYIADTIVVRA